MRQVHLIRNKSHTKLHPISLVFKLDCKMITKYTEESTLYLQPKLIPPE